MKIGDRILVALLDAPMTRLDLARSIAASPSGVDKALQVLSDKRLIEVVGSVRQTVGQKNLSFLWAIAAPVAPKRPSIASTPVGREFARAREERFRARHNLRSTTPTPLYLRALQERGQAC